MTHVPCGDGFVERVCRDVACYIDSMVGCYNNSCKHAKRKEPDMLTADMARDMSGDQRVMEELELFERCIRGAAGRGERDACLAYCDCMDGAKEKAIEILRQRGFAVRRHVAVCGGVMQTPAYYAFW